MTTYPIHTLDTAPASSQPLLTGAEEKFGFIPNLLGVLAESPAALNAYLGLMDIYEEQTSFSPTERQVVLLATSHENECTYCMAGHSVIAGMQGVPADVVDALRDASPLAEPKLEALRSFTKRVVKQRGRVTEGEITAFLEAGYTRAAVLEVILGVGLKTLSNYTNHITHTPLDAAFQAREWSAAASSQCAAG